MNLAHEEISAALFEQRVPCTRRILDGQIHKTAPLGLIVTCYPVFCLNFKAAVDSGFFHTHEARFLHIAFRINEENMPVADES